MTDRIRRSLLFTPGNRPTAFAKGLASGADCLCIDLEDAVPPDQKEAARPEAVAFVAEGAAGGPERVIRINALTTRSGLEDLSALAAAAPAGGLVLLPKTSGPGDIRLVDAVLSEAGSGLRIAALIESAEGLAAVDEVAVASPRLAALLFGAIDLSADLGAELGSDTLRTAAARLVVAARKAGIDALDVPELGFRDNDAVAAAAIRARQNGFTGKAAIHPTNVAAINAAFTPSTEDIAEARAVVEAFEASPNGLAVVDGRLIEAPVVKAMQRRLALAAAAGV